MRIPRFGRRRFRGVISEKEIRITFDIATVGNQSMRVCMIGGQLGPTNCSRNIEAMRTTITILTHIFNVPGFSNKVPNNNPTATAKSETQITARKAIPHWEIIEKLKASTTAAAVRQ